MEIWEEIKTVLEVFLIDGTYGRWLWPILFALLGFLCIFWFAKALYNKKKRNWDVLYFIPLVIAVFIWAVSASISATSQYPGLSTLFSLIEITSIIFLPCLIHLHVWKQVSYKVLTPAMLIFILLIPAALLGWLFYLVLPITSWAAPLAFTSAWRFVYYIYALVSLIRCYLLCFNVFYQMPKHMRRSSYHMIAATTTLILALAFSLVQNTWQNGAFLPYKIPLFAAALATYFLFNAMYANSAANVIATSRDFVFGSLTTMVLVLSRSMRILDWNKKDERADLLPTPKYKEPFEQYRTQMIEEGNGQVSPHGENIILTTCGGSECQYLITINPIQNKKRQFGYIAEITEITSVYSVLRLFEEIATVDQLTGLLNRNAYLDAVQKYVEENILPLWVVIGDINNLKQMNDTLGHLVGDSLLKTVSSFIIAAKPQNAFAYRIGGDEFALLMPGGYEEDIITFISRVNAQCATTYDEQFGTPSISWGYAARTDEAQNYNDIFAIADKMMYAVKKEVHQFSSSGTLPQKRQ